MFSASHITSHKRFLITPFKEIKNNCKPKKLKLQASADFQHWTILNSQLKERVFSIQGIKYQEVLGFEPTFQVSMLALV